VKKIDTNVMTTNVVSCSVFAKRHQDRQRARFDSVGSKMNPVLGAASGSPVTGLSIRGT
jgi:hypothetical protein